MPRIELCTIPQKDKDDVATAAGLDGRSVSDWGARVLARIAREEIAAHVAAEAASDAAIEASP